MSAMPPDADAGLPNLEHLSTAECEHRLAAAHFGRIAVIVRGRPPDAAAAFPLVVPIGYVWYDGAVWFRSAPGTKLAAALGEQVAFEIDGTDATYHSGWSVLVLGRAESVDDPARIAQLEALPVPRWVPGALPSWVVIRAERITGRSIPAPFEPHH